MKDKRFSRREFIAVSTVAGAGILAGRLPSAAEETMTKKTFTILHTNDMHSALIGMGPSSDYTPLTTNDDDTRGGFARIAAVLASRREARKSQGPVLLLDAGDFTMGTPFAAATRQTGGELQLMSHMGFDATTFGNHEFDLGPDGLGAEIRVASSAGRIPAILPSNSSFAASDPSLAELQRLAKENVIRRYVVIERGGIRFGIFGLIGKEATIYTSGAGAVQFTDAIETGKEMVKILRETEKVDVVICLSHGGVIKGKDGTYSEGDDLRVAREVPGIDVLVGGHSHTELPEPIIVNGRVPVVQTGKEGSNVGEMVITMDGDKVHVDSYQLHPIDDSIAGDPAIDSEINNLKKSVTAAVFASRGFSVDQKLVLVTQDIPNTFTDNVASTILNNLVTDSFREATKADIGLNLNGAVRASLKRGKTGVQTVYDVFAVAPLGGGIVDKTAGNALVTAYFTGEEIKNILNFFLVDSPTHPGEGFPRVSGMRFRYDTSRPRFDVVTAIELGDIDRGYKAIDITGRDGRLYSVTGSLMLASLVLHIPKVTKGTLSLVPKNKDGRPQASKVDALETPRESTPYLLAPAGTHDPSSIAVGKDPHQEIKEWQAIMEHLRNLPAKQQGELPIVPVDERAAEVRFFKAG